MVVGRIGTVRVDSRVGSGDEGLECLVRNFELYSVGIWEQRIHQHFISGP